jgi:hypothetical protein
MEPSVATLWAEPAAPAADISETAPQAAMRRVSWSWSVRLKDMAVRSMGVARGFCPVRDGFVRRTTATLRLLPQVWQVIAKRSCQNRLEPHVGYGNKLSRGRQVS